jgi:hypothetical protein
MSIKVAQHSASGGGDIGLIEQYAATEIEAGEKRRLDIGANNLGAGIIEGGNQSAAYTASGTSDEDGLAIEAERGRAVHRLPYGPL